MDPQCEPGRCENSQSLTFLHLPASYPFTIFPFHLKFFFVNILNSFSFIQLQRTQSIPQNLLRRSASSRMPFIRAFANFVKPYQENLSMQAAREFPPHHPREQMQGRSYCTIGINLTATSRRGGNCGPRKSELTEYIYKFTVTVCA